MDNLIGKICKVTSIVILSLAFLGSFSLCIDKYGEFDITLAFKVWVISFICSLLIYVLGEIVSLLDSIKYSTNETKAEIIKMQDIQKQDKKSDKDFYGIYHNQEIKTEVRAEIRNKEVQSVKDVLKARQELFDRKSDS